MVASSGHPGCSNFVSGDRVEGGSDDPRQIFVIGGFGEPPVHFMVENVGNPIDPASHHLDASGHGLDDNSRHPPPSHLGCR